MGPNDTFGKVHGPDYQGFIFFAINQKFPVFVQCVLKKPPTPRQSKVQRKRKKPKKENLIFPYSVSSTVLALHFIENYEPNAISPECAKPSACSHTNNRLCSLVPLQYNTRLNKFCITSLQILPFTSTIRVLLKTKIIYNPKSGKRKLQPLMSYVIEQLSESGCKNLEVYPTRGAGDAAQAAEFAAGEGCKLVIAVGGDGTASEVVHGLLRHTAQIPEVPQSEQAADIIQPTTQMAQIPVLGYIPSGTSNDFASALGIPGDVRKAVQIITEGHCAKIDVGLINQSRSFNYVVAAGAFTRLAYTAPHRLKRLLGVWAYLKDILLEFPLIHKPFPLQLRIDGQNICGEYVIALVINAPNFAGLRNVIPKACMDDGIFDILLLPKSNPKVFWSAIRGMALGIGKNITDSGIQHLRGSRISIHTERRLAWNIDGELGGKGPIDIECQTKTLPIMVPQTALQKVLLHQGNAAKRQKV